MIYLPYVIPVLALIGLAYIGIRYINLFFKINKLENEFSSIVNHTFRTPLTRILWLSKELEEDITTNKKLSDTQDITNAADRILGIVDVIADIKKINDISTYSFEAVSLREILEKSIEKYRYKIKEKNIKLNVSPFKDIPSLIIDKKKISFVIDTLIENAVFYTPQDGSIHVSCHNLKNKSIIFKVADTGIGLSLIDKIRIFGRFYRNKRASLINTDGMGLCLYLSNIIIKRHKGSIYMNSKGINKGSDFAFKLPINK